ncbi:MAG: copper chaperone PCu(A)C [Acidimicrobiales bacterium]
MNQHTRSRRLLAVPMALALSATVGLAGCGDDDDSAAGGTTTTTSATSATSTTEAAATEEIGVEAVWARRSPAAVTAGAAYMEITNPSDTDDALVDVLIDASIAGTVELHETSMAGGDADTSTTAAHGEGAGSSGEDSGGMMTMKEVDEIAVPAGETVVLEPGGYHVMLLDLVAPLEAGETIEITLVFAEAGEIVVEAEVHDTAP